MSSAYRLFWPLVILWQVKLAEAKVNMKNGVTSGEKFFGSRVSQQRSWVIIALFAALLSLTGGASRYDEIQIVALRSLSAVFVIPAIYFVASERLKADRTLAGLFFLYVLLVVIQLIPLPAEIWGKLPGRGDLRQMDVVLGLGDVWRPMTLAPLRTWNVLGSLIVPGMGLLLVITLGVSSNVLMRIVAVLGVSNALLGLFQIASGDSGIFYLYDVTNRGSPVGLFANENHSGIFAACSMLVVTRLGLEAGKVQGAAWGRLFWAMAFFLIFAVSLLSGSRAGFSASVGAMAISITMIALSPRSTGQHALKTRKQGWVDRHPRLLLAIPITLALLTAAAFLTLGRTPAFRDLLSEDSFADLRWSLWPVIVEILETHWIFGAGFGSFEQVYQTYEPTELLMSVYINQAHNDWVQLIIEGGVVAALILLSLFVWMTRAIVALSSSRGTRVRGIFWVSNFAIISAASLIDYPLRTPLFQVVAIWFLLALSRDWRDMNAT